MVQARISFRVDSKTYRIDEDFDNGLYLVMGPNGSGKTTFLKVLLGLHPCDGTVVCDKPVGYLPQHYQPLHTTVHENLALFGALDMAENSLLKAKLHVPALRLSGGEKALLGLYQVMALKPKTLLVDEVTAHLDQQSTRHIEQMLLAYSKNAVVFMVTHQWDTLLRLKSPVLVFDGARLYKMQHEQAYNVLLRTLTD